MPLRVPSFSGSDSSPGVQDERLRLEVAQLLLGRVDEHRPREERVVGVAGDDADGDPLLRISTGERVDHVEVVAAADVRGHLLAQPLEVLLRDLGVDVPEPDPLRRARLADDELVLRRAAGVLAGVDGERPTLGEPALTPRQRIGVELRRRGVPVDGPGRLDSVL